MVDVVLDSSVIIGLSRLTDKHKKYARNKSELPYFELIDMMIKGSINVVVPQTVYREIKRGKEHDHGIAQDFLNDSCEVLQTTQEEKDLSLKVLKDYANLVIDGRTAMYLAKDNTEKNYRDGRIVAEISVEQLGRGKRIPFITNNLKDVKDIKRINEVNKRHGLPEIFICPLSRYMDAIMFAKREDKEFNNRTL